MRQHKTSSTLAGHTSIGRGPGYFSSQLAQLCSECVQVMQRVSCGRESERLDRVFRREERQGMGPMPPLTFHRAMEKTRVQPPPAQHPPAGPRCTGRLRVPHTGMQHSPTGSSTWHPSGRMGAAAFRLLSGTEANLTEWGRWKRKTQARYYAKAPKTWKLPEILSLPYPEKFCGFQSRDVGGVSIRTKDLWPKESWEKRAGPHKLAPKAPPEKLTGRRGQPES